jgi:hypothetical protein
MIEVAVVVFIVVVSVLIWGLALVDRADVTDVVPETSGGGAAEADGTPVPADSEGERTEMGLAGRLLDGDLSPAEYHQAMAVLAADDARSRPLVAPPN